MIDLNNIEIKNLICNETSAFALSIIDIENAEVIYSNDAMEKLMANSKAKKCWEAVYAQNSICPWCGIKNLLNIHESKIKITNQIFQYEHFSEVANTWYQIQNRAAKLKNGKNILISIALDISSQKKAQGELITAQVNLVQQTQALKNAQEELQKQASTDPMTQLYNRRYFMKTSEHILNLAKRDSSNLSVVMADIDKFKSINDTYGHKVGDDIIILLSRMLEKSTRASDIVCRFGGEEFIILLPETDRSGAVVIAEKIQTEIKNFTIGIDNSQTLHFTISMGVSQINIGQEDTIDALIQRADKAMYKAKQSGRNRVCI